LEFRIANLVDIGANSQFEIPISKSKSPPSARDERLTFRVTTPIGTRRKHARGGYPLKRAVSGATRHALRAVRLFTVLLCGEFGIYLPASNAGLHLSLLAVYGPAYYSASTR
jgi:hypothetical protein